MEREEFEQIDSIFHPESIAVLGASPDSPTIGNVYVDGLLSAGFTGRIYPVNPKGGEIQGLKIYRSLMDIPYPVDYVISSIPREGALPLLDDCIAKKVKTVQFFTAGFREADMVAGRGVEEEMLAKARQGNFRIVGPNCVGTCSPEVKMPLGPLAIMGDKVGTVGYLCQSGGLSEKVAELGISRGIDYSKGVSLGNGIDLDVTAFLDYLATDDKTQIIGIYMEGVNDGREFLRVLESTTRKKPVVIYKGGATKSGAEAAISHTGSLTTDAAIWSAVFKQAGAIEAQSIEEIADNILLLQNIKDCPGNDVTIIAGLAGGGGGACVSATDECVKVGLNVPSLQEKTRRGVAEICGEVGTILHNPVDVGPRGWSNPETFGRVLEIVTNDPKANLVLVHEDMFRFKQLKIPWEAVRRINEFVIEIGQRKPVVVVMPYGASNEVRWEMERMLIQAKIAVYPSFKRAAQAILNVRRYLLRRDHRS